MKNFNWVKLVGFVGLFIALYGLISAIFYANTSWYSYFVFGGTFFLSSITYSFSNSSILKILEKKWTKAVKIYFIYLTAAILIEIIGRLIFGWWEYPHFGTFEMLIHVFLIGYPFALFFVYESFLIINHKIRTLWMAIVLTTLFNAFLHEIPNLYAFEWKYYIPLISLEIFGINIVIIVGWVVLVLIPFWTNKYLD